MKQENRVSRPPLKGRDGTTLVEVVVGLFIFGLFVAGMCRLLVLVNESTDRARDHYVAVNIGKNRIERARAFDFSQLTSVFTENNVLVDVNGQPATDTNFRRSTQIISSGTNLVEMVVTVDIRNRKSWAFDGPSEQIRTYIGDLKGPPGE